AKTRHFTYSFSPLSSQESMSAQQLLSEQEARFRDAQIRLFEYRTMIENALAALPRELSDEEMSRYLELPEPIRDAFKSWLEQNKKRQADDEFPRMARYSLMVMIFWTMETRAHDLCDSLSELKSIGLEWNDLSGDFLRRLRVYARLGKLALP